MHADSLVAGDRLITRDGTEVTVTANTLDLTPSLVYNLEVADAHTYFVGDFDVWSHNAGVYGWLWENGTQYWGRTYQDDTGNRANQSKNQRSRVNGGAPTCGLRWNSTNPIEIAIWERILIRQAKQGNKPLNNKNMPGIPKKYRSGSN